MATDNKTFLDDRESLEAIVSTLPPPLKREYLNYRFLSLEAGFPGRKLVVYRLEGGHPVDIEVLTLGHMSMEPYEGPIIEVTSDRRPGTKYIGVVPQKLAGRDVFLHVPQKFEFRWKGKRVPKDGVHFAPHYAVLIKTIGKPLMRTDGETYCVRLNQFWEMYPDVNVGY